MYYLLDLRKCPACSAGVAVRPPDERSERGSRPLTISVWPGPILRHCRLGGPRLQQTASNDDLLIPPQDKTAQVIEPQP